MASTLNLFEREIKLATADLEPAAVRRALAAYARSSVAEVIGSGQAPAQYERFVNGRHGAPEETVQLPGPIVYMFSNWRLVIEFALEELRKRSPHKSGRYAASFLVVVNNRVVTEYSSIPADAEVIVLNHQPYTRKIEVGANGAGRRHFDLTKAALNRRFSGAFAAQTMFLDVSPGLHPGMPYVLKQSQGRRKGRQSGQRISYPALVIGSA